jgi:CubicO group peptidase (beta-lactamase class C family)
VRDILHSSGGVPHGSFSTTDPAALPEQQAFLPWSGMVVFPPGEVWEYSNFSLGLTEVVAEGVSGQAYEEFIRKFLFIPLSMNDASARYVDRMAETSAVRYSASLDRLVSRGGAMPFGGLGMYASVNDLLAFGMFNLDPQRTARP